MNDLPASEFALADNVDVDISLLKQGVSIPAVLKLLDTVRQDYGVHVTPEVFLQNPTLGQLRSMIERGGCDLPAEADSLNTVVRVCRQLLNNAEIDIDRDLFEQGVNSLTLLSLVRQVSQELHVEIDVEAFLKAPTLRLLGQSARQVHRSPPHTAAPDPSGIGPEDQNGGSLSILSSKQDKQIFLRRQLNLRHVRDDQPLIPGLPLPAADFEARYTSRMSRRSFDEIAVSREQLLRWLGHIDGMHKDGQTKYLYPSAGGTYAVQVYIEVKPGGVDGVDAGSYYYHPLRHCLVRLTSVPVPRTAHFFYNRPHYDACGFCLYFVAEYKGIEPIYQKESEFFVAVETGAIIQLLREHQGPHAIGSCILSGVDNAIVGENLGLGDSQRILLSLACGKAAGLAEVCAVDNGDIAIVGVHGQFPGADDLDQLWENLKAGKLSFSSPPSGRWGPLDAQNVLWGGFLADPAAFDAALFDISAEDAARMDPQERAFLSCVQRLLDQSAYSGANLARLSQSVGVFVGAMWNDAQHDTTQAGYTPLSSVANRVSFTFDWTGPSLAIDTSCSSALSAIYLACQSIRQGDCRAAVAGGVNLFGSAAHLDNLRQFNLLSKQRESDTFGDCASGWIAGEGVGAVLLKRLSDAEADRDHIWGVIRGGSLAAGGKVAKYGMPSIERQAQLMRQALHRTHSKPDAVQYVETAAAGSAVGDASEILAITRVFGARQTPLRVGTVKPNIGHLESASGMSQLAKVLLQMKHRMIPAIVPYRRLNPLIAPQSSTVEIVCSNSAWQESEDQPCVALVNGFGGTGSYASLLVESYHGTTCDDPDTDSIPIVFVLSAPSESQLYQYATEWRQFLARQPDLPSLPQIVAVLQTGRRALRHRLALLPDSLDDLRQLLARFLDAQTDAAIIGGVAASPARKRCGLSGQQRRDIAQSWVLGEWDAWEELYPPQSVAKLPLPTCPMPTAASAATAAMVDAPPLADGDGATEIRDYLERAVGVLTQTSGGAHDSAMSFFERGLSSAGMVALAKQLQEAAGERIPPAVFFDHPSVDGLARHLHQYYPDACRALAIGLTRTPAPASKPASADASPYPLSEGQTGLWILQKSVPDMAAYNCPIALRLSETVEPALLARTCEWLAQQYPLLATVIDETGGAPLQSPRKRLQPTLTVVNVDGDGLNDDALIGRLRTLAKLPFDLEEALWRVDVVPCGPSTVVLFTLHHLIFDGGSFLPFIDAFLSVLKALAAGETPRPPALPASFADFVAAERALLASDEGARHLAYWKERLHGPIEPLSLPLDFVRPRTLTFAGATCHLRLPTALSEQLRQFARDENSYPSAVFLSAFKLLLWHYSAQDDIVVGMPVDMRGSDARNMLGYCVNMAPIRSRMESGLRYRELLRTVQISMAEALEHPYPFAALVRELAIRPNAQHAPLFQAAFSYQNFIDPAVLKELYGPSGQPVEFIDAVTQEGEYEVLLEIWEHEAAFMMKLKYNSDLYLPATATRMLEHLQILLQGVIDDSGLALAGYSLLSPQDKRLLQDWNSSARTLPHGHCLHQFVEIQARTTPQRCAAEYDGVVLTYAELDGQANRLARGLQQLGAGPGALVGVCADRSLEMLVALLAILKAGSAYVPIDPDFPRERIGFIVQDAQLPIVLTEQKYQDKFTGMTATLQCLDEAQKRWHQEPITPPAVSVTPDDLAYVIYTSGSTGNPKGCMLSHAAVCNRLWWMQAQYGLDEHDRVLQKTPFSFDVSVWEFFWPLISGATLVFAAPGGHKDPNYLIGLIEAKRITTCHFVPSMLAAFLPALRTGQCATLERLFTSGEALSYALLEQCNAKLGPILHNLYGPTEAAVDVSYWRGEHRPDHKVPIGQPIANVQLHVLGPDLETRAIGLAGELHIGGICLARGYLNRPELTEEKFIANPYSSSPGARLYKTGDLARWLPDGTIEYLGRIDHQVKIRGFRIEPGEIEARLREHADVRDAVVHPWVDIDGDRRLVAYVIPNGDAAPGAATLRAFLALTLPEYMLPSAFVMLEDFPLTPSGKLDRKALPNPAPLPDQSHDYLPPRTPTEVLLARLWCEVLGLNRVGARDNFFDLGGHSLKAVNLIARMAGTFGGGQISQLDFYREPTIEAVARLIDSQAQSGFQALPLLAKGTAATTLSLVCVPYAGASVTVFQPFADALCARDSGIAVYGSALPGNEFGSRAHPEDSVLSLAAARADEIMRRVDGPIGIYGHCVGSFLALELTRQLEMRGRQVQFLALGAAFPFPRIIRYLPFDDPWRWRGDRSIHRLIQSWGGSTEPVADETLAFMIANFRKDAKLAFLYEKRRSRWTIQAPIYNIVSADDSLTKHYARRVRRWREVAHSVRLVVIEQGKHYFIGNQPDLVADIICNRDRIALRDPDDTSFYTRDSNEDN
jgi:amino acid adenylation domain-containing protein